MNRNDEEGEFPIMRGERRIRFVCGVIAGLLAGCPLAPRFGAHGAGAVLLMVATGLAFGFAAAFLGDRFWKGFL
jgi:O-antigen/teichoic acid export membrane protein